MNRDRLISLVSLWVCCLAGSALAQTAPVPVRLGALAAQPAASAQGALIGSVKTVTGNAMIVSGGQSVKAVVGTPVMQGSVLRTAAASTLGVSFVDGTMMSFGPDTELTVNEFLYSPVDKQLKLNSSLAKGTLNYVSGMIAKLKPEAVNLQTPSGMIGVRGTQFAVKVEAGEK